MRIPTKKLLSPDLLGEPAYWSCLAVAAVLFAVSCNVMNSYRLPATDTTLKI